MSAALAALEARLAELERLPARVHELEQQVAALRAGTRHKSTPAAAARAPEEGARTFTGPEVTGRVFAMPTEAEVDQLLGIVLERYPQLAPRPPINPQWADQEQLEFRQEFAAAFRILGEFSRTAEPDAKKAASFWVDRAMQRLHGRDIGTVRLPSFTAALVAHGDITFAPLDRFPYDLAFGLRDGDAGEAVGDGWRAVLASRKLREPMVVERRR
jgi:hypothetical protein